MDGEDSQGSPLPPRVENRAQVDNALRAIHQKKPVPEIDFTLHTMEDGTQVSTMERVCKGTLPLFYCGVWPIKCRQGVKTNKSSCQFWNLISLWTVPVRIYLARDHSTPRVAFEL
jgi:hypothetical protein